MFASLLALGSCVCWGVSDFLGGMKGRALPLLSVLLVSQSTALALLVTLVIVKGAAAPEPKYLLFAAGAGLAEVLGLTALYRGLSSGTMSIVAPIANVAPALPIVVSLALGEIPTRSQVAGLFLVVVGITLTTYHGPSGDSSRRGRSVAYGFVAAAGFGTFFVGMDAASEGVVSWALLGARLTAFTAVVVASLVARLLAPPAAGATRADIPALMTVGALIVGADFMYATASTRGLLGIVAALGALHPVVTVALARVYLRERIERVQYAGIAACICGVVAITAF